MTPIPHVDRDAWMSSRDAYYRQYPAKYYSMYSSLIGGVVTDPVLMVAPIDDHLVHRGDGVFETLKCVESGIYNLRAHLERLRHSAEAIQLVCPYSIDELEHIICETVRAARQSDVQIRVLLSRGPGSLGVNPNDCPAPQLYVITAPLVRPFMETHPHGARIGFSSVPAKPPPFAAIKTCNYLPNALMAKEASDRKLDFIVGLDAKGRALEGPTENILAISADSRLITPDSPDVLPGTTLGRVLELCEPLLADGRLSAIERAPIPCAVFANAREAMIVGTSHDLVSVIEIEGQPVGDGQPGPIWQTLSRQLADDVRTGERHRTQI